MLRATSAPIAYAAVVCMTACMAVAGCTDKAQEPEAVVVNNDNVHLPPVPELTLLDVPATYKDGSQSIIGLLLNKDKNLQKSVTVSGVMKDLYTCDIKPKEDKAKKDETEVEGPVPGCKHPHFYLADSAESPKKVLITGYKASWYEPQLQPNARYKITGFYTLQSAQFSASESGLIIVDSIEGSGVEPPPAPEDEN